MKIVGILLAAGRGARFDARAGRAKLLETYPPGGPGAEPIALRAARSLCAVLDPVIAVVRREADEATRRLCAELAGAGCRLVAADPPSPEAEGTGHSIAQAVRATRDADGWVVALGDMPAVTPATIRALHQALADGAWSAAPYYGGRRGHPVGFSAACGGELASLAGDQGAREVLRRFPPRQIEVDDPGVLYDVDTPEDLRRGPSAGAVP